MKASEAIRLVVERKKPSPEWTNTDGIYADLSKWPDEVFYYVQCPKCKQVHGHFKTMIEAHRNRHCDHCSAKNVDKIKDEIFKVLWEPDKKVKPIAQLVGEAENAPLPPELPPQGDPDPDDIDPKADTMRLLAGNWVVRAVRQLESIIHDNLEIDSDRDWYGADYDPDNPDDATTVYVKTLGDTEEYLIFKDEDVARAAAIADLKNSYESEPEIYTNDFTMEFIDKDKLAQAIGDPNEDWGDEERNLDYEEKLDRMVEEDRIESDDPIFFKRDGDKRTQNRDRERQLDEIVDKWAEDTKPEIDPMQWLEDVYGKEEAKKEALKLAGIDVDKWAEAAIDADGWPHQIARYDGHSIQLKDGVAARIN